MAESLTLYKLIILYMLDNVSVPLITSNISEFILDKGYTDFFTLNQALGDLVDTALVKSELTNSKTFYSITKNGTQTLAFFQDKISDTIITELDHYLLEHKMDIIEKSSVVADFYKNTNNEYVAVCKVREKDTILAEIKLTVDTREQAELICNKWNDENQGIYAFLLSKLLT